MLEQTRVSSMCTLEVAVDILGEIDTDKDSQVKLCNSHYQELYKAINQPSPCTSCHSKPKSGECFVRTCPNPHFITAFLRQNEGFEGNISNDSKICNECYAKHRKLLASHNREVNEFSLLSVLKEAKDNFLQSSNIDNAEQYFQGIGSMIAFSTVTKLADDTAVLLPELYDMFTELIHENKNKTRSFDEICKNIPSARWLLMYLQNNIGSYMDIATKVKKHGVILYRHDGDVLMALSKSLHELRDIKKSEKAARQNAQLSTKQLQQNKSLDNVTEVCEQINLIFNIASYCLNVMLFLILMPTLQKFTLYLMIPHNCLNLLKYLNMLAEIKLKTLAKIMSVQVLRVMKLFLAIGEITCLIVANAKEPYVFICVNKFCIKYIRH
jgi:hypothetical protein